MKRALIQSVKVTPYTSEDAINREGFLSGILAVKVGSPSGSPTGMAVKLTITESDQQSTGYAPVKDKLVCVGNAPLDDAGVISVTTDAAGGELVNFDLDLVGPQAVHQGQGGDFLLRRLHYVLRGYRCPGPGRRFRGPRLIWP